MPSVAPNLQWGTAVGFVAACIEYAFSCYGHPLPEPIADGLPAFLFFVVSQLHDMKTGQNKPNP